MSSTTPNIGLVKQAGTEYGDNDITNSNLDKLDTEIGLRGKTVNGVGPDAHGDYKVDEVQFARDIITEDAQQSSGEFLFRTTGGDASLSDGDAKLVAIYGRRVHTGIVEESLTLTVNAVPREIDEETEIEEDTITATIDRDTFVAYVSQSGTITLTYTDAWSANPTLYGVTVVGTPVAGDEIVIVYVKADLGTITQSDPTRFVSTGWNLYDNTNGYAHVKKYSTTYGFLIGGTYTKLEFSATLTGTKTTITPVSGYFTIPSDGYLFVTGGNTTTYILMTWSDWGEGYEGDFAQYTESEVDLTTIMENFPYGLMQVGGVSDEINFSMAKAISRISRMANTAENLVIAEASGRDYECDTNYIYIVNASETAYDILNESGNYTASDHGMEFVDGTSVPVFVQTLYGQNLVDKLRTDVLTISQQTLSSAQQAQVKSNLGFANQSSVDSLREIVGIGDPLADLNNQGRRMAKTGPNTLNTPYKEGMTVNTQGLCIQYADASTGNYNQQLLMENGGTRLFVRRKNNGTWGSWDEYVLKSEYRIYHVIGGTSGVKTLKIISADNYPSFYLFGANGHVFNETIQIMAAGVEKIFSGTSGDDLSPTKVSNTTISVSVKEYAKITIVSSSKLTFEWVS